LFEDFFDVFAGDEIALFQDALLVGFAEFFLERLDFFLEVVDAAVAGGFSFAEVSDFALETTELFQVDLDALGAGGQHRT
jgi:hypothetical protein